MEGEEGKCAGMRATKGKRKDHNSVNRKTA